MTMKTDWQEIFKGFNSKNILVIGDVMIDSYVVGNVNRISPEAPVPVVSVSKRYNRLGGAANVALNLKSLGANAILCSAIGNDSKGKDFMDLLEKRSLSKEGILMSEDRITTTKFRVIGNKTQMLRVDEEDTNKLSSKDFVLLSGKINHLLNTLPISAVIFEDYDKGIIDSRLVDFVIKKASEKNIIITADPKKDNFSLYSNLTIFKPNLKELNEGEGLNIKSGDIEAITKASRELIRQKNHRSVLVTLSEYGMLSVEAGEAYHAPAEIRNIADVSGAGDTVISTVTLALCAGLDMKRSVGLANLAGGLVCETVGVVPIERNRLLNEVINSEL